MTMQEVGACPGPPPPSEVAAECWAPCLPPRLAALEEGGVLYFFQVLSEQLSHQLIVDVILMIKVCKCFRHGLKGFSGFQLIRKDCREEFEDKTTANTVFDRHEFSVSKDHFPFRAIQITKKPPAWRTDLEVKHLRNRLQLLESFRQYSPTLQNLLARVVRFERFGRRRVIIRKGQWGDSFYFINFGTVGITDDDDGSSAFVEASPTVLRSGASFGELALLQGKRRIATVVCMEETELLVVDKKDFFAYKLDKELHREFRHRYEFFRALDLFKTLSDGSIEALANICKVERFHYGQVIASDLAESATAIFVTKGITEVLRLVDLTTCPSYHMWLLKQRCLRKRKPQEEKRSLAAEITCVDRFKSTMWNSYSGQKLNRLKDYYVQQEEEIYEDWKTRSSFFNKSHKSVVIKVDMGQKSVFCEQQEEEPEIIQNVVSGVCGKHLAYTTSYGNVPSSVAAAVYIRVDELRKGEYTISLQDERTMIMVSQGAEIIRLRKDKIEECADDATVMKLSNMQIQYPSDDELCQIFLRQNSWEMFKKDLLNLVMQPKLVKMVHPPHPCPTEEIYTSWHMNQAGILDLSDLYYGKPVPPQKGKYIPVQPKQTKRALPDIQPRLIHGITVMRPNLDGAF
ncbi:cyclic nucleotide-binding domain-containing protein 2 [Varanus komodoensis]|uniref:cyclic nucleotide-binding domain-containing protein 2 n=1 Tax=Varanus komodoensis TaxID=61221 RepID=UPI001CF7B7C6|nr:cyclic nucleotide-binding domain-containing protein 2 [Varanus komodoensis]